MENIRLAIIGIILFSSQITMAYFLYRLRQEQDTLRKIMNHQSLEIIKIKRQWACQIQDDNYHGQKILTQPSDFSLQKHDETGNTAFSDALFQAKQGASKEQLMMDYGLEFAEADLLVNGYGTQNP